MGRTVRILGFLLAVFGVLSLRVSDPQLLQELRWKIFDTYQRIAPRAYEPAPVVVVDIDEAALASHGQWPWSRTKVAALVDAITDAGAASIALDFVFAEPDRTSPIQIGKDWEGSSFGTFLDGLKKTGVLPDNDIALATALANAPSVLGFFNIHEENDNLPQKKASIATAGDDPRQFVHNFPGAISNLQILEANALGNGSTHAEIDSDGTLRRATLLVRIGEELYPSLAAEALRVAQGASTYIVKSSGASGESAYGEQSGITQVRIGDFILPTDQQGAVWLHDTGPKAERRVSAADVLAGTLPEGRLAGMIVLIGTSSQGLKDQHTTPLSPVTPGVEVHAQILEQAILGQFLVRPDWADGAELTFLLVFSLLLIGLFAIPNLGALLPSALSVLAIGGAIGGPWYAYSEHSLLMDPLYPSVCGALIYSGTSFLKFWSTEQERRRVRGAFSQYMSPEMVAVVAKDPDKLVLGGEMRELTLLFCDLRGFTSVSEKLTPHELTDLINRFLTPMTRVIMAKQGTIDKYMGDCVMAFWNAPLDDPDHRQHAVEASYQMRSALEKLNEELASEASAKGEEPIKLGIGIGINTGVCCVGNMGSELRFDYSALGDDVNLASRLEGQSKNYGVELVVSEATIAPLPQFNALELDLVRVVGRAQPVRIFTLIPGDLPKDELAILQDHHDEMIDAYRSRHWDKAQIACDAAAVSAEKLELGLTKLYQLYRDRIEAFRQAPPAEDWDGVYTAESK